MRPGWGERHPDVEQLLRRVEPVAFDDIFFGVTALRRAAHLGEVDLNDDLILSVRCIVFVGDQLLVCTNENYPWPDFFQVVFAACRAPMRTRQSPAMHSGACTSTSCAQRNS